MLATSPGPGPAQQQLPALASGAPRGATGHRVGSDGSTGWEQGSEPGCGAGPPAHPHSAWPWQVVGCWHELTADREVLEKALSPTPQLCPPSFSQGCRAGSPWAEVS